MYFGDELMPPCPMSYMMAYLPPFSMYDEGDMMRQPESSVVKLLRQFESQMSHAFTELERYRVPRFFIRRVFRAVIGYVLKVVDMTKPLPQAVNQYAVTLFNRMESAQPTFISVLTFFKVPYDVVRDTFINLIRFVLNNLPHHPPTKRE